MIHKPFARALLAGTALPLASLLFSGVGRADEPGAAAPLILAQAAPSEAAPGSEERPARERPPARAGERPPAAGQPGERRREAQPGSEEPSRGPASRQA